MAVYSRPGRTARRGRRKTGEMPRHSAACSKNVSPNDPDHAATMRGHDFPRLRTNPVPVFAPFASVPVFAPRFPKSAFGDETPEGILARGPLGTSPYRIRNAFDTSPSTS